MIITVYEKIEIYYSQKGIKIIMKNIKEYNLEELKEEMISLGEKPYRAEQIFKMDIQR